MKHDPKTIKSAHEKQRKWAIGHGGVNFTPEERAVLDEGIPDIEDGSTTGDR